MSLEKWKFFHPHSRPHKISNQIDAAAYFVMINGAALESLKRD